MVETLPRRSSTRRIAVNENDGNRLIIGASNGVYESTDHGTTVSAIGNGIRVNGFQGDPIIYGVPGNADLLYVADDSDIFARTTAPPAPLVAVTPPGGTINDLTIDPDSPSRLFALDSNQVFFSTNAGSTWGDVTGDLLSSFDPGTFRTMVFIPGDDNAIVVGANRGTYVAFESTGFSDWDALGTDLPNAIVMELDYDAADDALIAGLLGRGAFKLQPALAPGADIFTDGFESGDASAWTSSVP